MLPIEEQERDTGTERAKEGPAQAEGTGAATRIGAAEGEERLAWRNKDQSTEKGKAKEDNTKG